MCYVCILVVFQRRFPDFSYITRNGPLTEFLDCVIIRCVLLYFSSYGTYFMFVGVNAPDFDCS